MGAFPDSVHKYKEFSWFLHILCICYTGLPIFDGPMQHFQRIFANISAGIAAISSRMLSSMFHKKKSGGVKSGERGGQSKSSLIYLFTVPFIKRSGISVKSYGVARWVRRIWTTLYIYIYTIYTYIIFFMYLIFEERSFVSGMTSSMPINQYGGSINSSPVCIQRINQ